MAQLVFNYGVMSSGKTIEILKVAHNYRAQGRNIALMTSSLDNRSGRGMIASRIGLKRPAKAIDSDLNLFAYIKEEIKQQGDVACVLIDEAQFMTKKQVLQCAQIVDELHVPVLTFGLKNDFQNNLFEGSKYLLLYADKLTEIKTICVFCTNKATMNLRIHNCQPVYEGDQVQIGGNESYYPVCRWHYFHPGN